MRLTHVRFTVRRMMAGVAIFAVVLGLLVLADREANRQINLVESEHWHYRASVEKAPARKAELLKRAETHDRLIRYYEFGW
jgi:hypothetical protein